MSKTRLKHNMEKDKEKFTKGKFLKYLKLINKIKLIIKDILSKIKYGQIYIFDTNMVISNSKKDLRHIKLMTLNNNYWITETISDEVNDFLSREKYRLIQKRKLETISFSELRNKYPNVCPLYYNYISAMHNPAIVWGENFGAEMAVRALIKNGLLNDEEDKINTKTINRLVRKRDSEKDKLLKLLGKSSILNLSKKRNAIRKSDKNYFNDLKSLSLSLLYCLQEKKNVTFITSDSDFLNIIFDMFSTIIQQSTFDYEILPQLTNEIKLKILNGKTHSFFLNSFEFKKHMDKYTGDAFSDNWKKDYLIFNIKYWDIKEQKYTKLEFRFNETMRQLFLNSHGNLECPFVKNNDCGSWIHYRYWWPPNSIHNINILKVMIRVKNIINKENIRVNNNIHKTICKYPQQDASNQLINFSQFY